MPPVLDAVRTTVWLVVALLAVVALSLCLLLARRRTPEHHLLRLFLYMLLGAALTGSGLLAPATPSAPFELGELAVAVCGLLLFAASVFRFVRDANLPSRESVATQPLGRPGH
jgi:NADH:ubiquinone oxidoreductase subunit 6 (subunit J)